jgi:Ca2+-dependent lipid-binding protein
LAPKDKNGLSDPYVKVLELREKTSIHKKTLYPVWNHRIHRTGSSANAQLLVYVTGFTKKPFVMPGSNTK